MELSPEAQRLAPIVVAVIVLWFTEALPLAVTALLGAVACVVAGVAPAKEVFRPFADPLIFLFIGSFLLAEAIRQHRLDRRLAYAVLSLPAVGERPVGIMAAVALVSVAISAFISNTVTAAMMLAIVSGILAAIDEAANRSGVRPAVAFATGLHLCIAFARVDRRARHADRHAHQPDRPGLHSRADRAWTCRFRAGAPSSLPIVAVMAAFLVVVMAWMFPAGVDRLVGVQAFVQSERSRLGRWTMGQRSTALAFGVDGSAVGRAGPVPRGLGARSSR